MGKPNTREVKLNVKAGKFPEKMLKDMEFSFNKIKKVMGEIPKELKDWSAGTVVLNNRLAKTQANIKNESRELQHLEAVHASLSKSRQKANERDMKASMKRLAYLTKEESAYKRAINTSRDYQKMQRGSGGGGMGGYVDAFKQGGIRGLGGKMMGSGIGKLGMAGALGYGAYKTWDWASNKAKTGRDYQTSLYGIGRGAGVGGNFGGSSYALKMAREAQMGTDESSALLSDLKSGTGGALLGDLDAVGALGKYTTEQGLKTSDVASIMESAIGMGAVGTEAGSGRSADMMSVMNTFSASMESGLAKGFDRSKRIAQLISINEDMASGTGEVSADATRRSSAMLEMLQGTGRRKFMGGGGVKVIEGMNAVLKSGSDKSKAMFASMLGSGMLGRDITEKYTTARGGMEGEAGFQQLSELDKIGRVMDELLSQKSGMEAFAGMAQALKSTGLAASIISDITGMDSGDVSRLLTDMEDKKITPEIFAQKMKEAKEGAGEALKGKEKVAREHAALQDVKMMQESMAALTLTIDANTKALRLVTGVYEDIGDSDKTRRSSEGRTVLDVQEQPLGA